MVTPLWMRCAQHAAKAPAHVLGAALALLASALLWNPLPLALFAVGSGLWLLQAATSVRYARRVLDSEARSSEAKAREVRAERASMLQLRLLQPPCADAIRRGTLPDYAFRYRELEGLSEKIRAAASARPELALEWTVDLERELARLLSTYLDLADARVQQLEALAGEGGFSTLEKRVGDAEREIERLERLVREQPETASIRRSHIDVLRRRCEQLRTSHAHDQRLQAELDALPDVFRFLHERVSGAELDSGAISAYLGEVVSQVQEVAPAADARQPIASPVH